MVFLGDEGRDMLIVKRMIVDHKFTLLGPTTSVGSIYMGPVYYYMMIPFLWAWNLDPVGPSVMVAILSVFTVFLIYLIGRDFFHKNIGLIASFLYAISPLTILYGRSSWNPNVVPFFSTLLIYALLSVVVKKKNNFLLLAGFCLGILIQLHYVTLMLVPIIIGSLALIRFKVPIKKYILSFIFFIVSFSPFLLFELRHQFVNLQQALRFLLVQNQEAGLKISSFTETFADVFVRLFWRLVFVENAELTKLFILIIFSGLYIFSKNKGSGLNSLGFKVILVWLFAGVLSFGLYRGVIYDYYFGALFSVPFILVGIFFHLLSEKKGGKYMITGGLLILSFFAYSHSPLKIPPNNLMGNTKQISKFVFDHTQGNKYNFALIAGKNSDHAYRYFLEVWGRKPTEIENPEKDPERKTVEDQLLVVCEEKVCQPLGHPLWEIAGFGRAEIVDEWPVSTAKVFRLVRYLPKEQSSL